MIAACLHSPDGVSTPARWRVSCPTFSRWGPGPYPVASVLSYIHTMGSWPLPGGECLVLHSHDGVLAPTRWRVSCPTFTRWGPGPYPVASVLSYIHPMESRLLPGGERLVLHSPDGVSTPARWRVSCPTFIRWSLDSCPVASVLSYIHLMESRLLPGVECPVLHSPDGVSTPARWRVSCPTFSRWGPGPYPLASIFSYIHTMGSWPLPGGEYLLLHSHDGVLQGSILSKISGNPDGLLR